MIDQKKYTLEDDLREVAGWLSLHGPAHAPLRDRLLKWADGQDPNEPDVDLRGLKVGDEVTFGNGTTAVVQRVRFFEPDGGYTCQVCFIDGDTRLCFYYKNHGSAGTVADRNIISYRTPPFDFQRSYDRGVRRFVMRNGSVTSEVHWFKDDGLFYPVRDGLGYGWTDTGHHQLTLKEHPRDLIAEAPAEVQREGEA